MRVKQFFTKQELERDLEKAKRHVEIIQNEFDEFKSEMTLEEFKGYEGVLRIFE